MGFPGAGGFRVSEVGEVVAGDGAGLADRGGDGDDARVGAFADRAGGVEIAGVGDAVLAAVRVGDAGGQVVGVVGASGFKEVGIAGAEFAGGAVGGGGDGNAGSGEAGVLATGKHAVEAIADGLGDAADFIALGDLIVSVRKEFEAGGVGRTARGAVGEGSWCKRRSRSRWRRWNWNSRRFGRGRHRR